jgi:hypothetical protein
MAHDHDDSDIVEYDDAQEAIFMQGMAEASEDTLATSVETDELDAETPEHDYSETADHVLLNIIGMPQTAESKRAAAQAELDRR